MTSEIARLRAQIEAEYEAARLGLTGLAEGTARHQIISARMERIGSYVDDLTALVGIEKAAAILVEAMESQPQPPTSTDAKAHNV